MTNLIIYHCFRYFAFYAFNLLLANITNLLCFFFLFLAVFNNFFASPVDSENVRLRPTPAIPTGVQITVASDRIEMLVLVADKKIKIIKRNKILAKYFTQ